MDIKSLGYELHYLGAFKKWFELADANCPSVTTTLPPPGYRPPMTQVVTVNGHQESELLTGWIVGSKSEMNINSSIVRWTSPGIPGIRKVELAVYEGVACSGTPRTSTVVLDKASNPKSGSIEIHGSGIYSPKKSYSGRLNVTVAEGTFPSSCIHLGPG
jgi:hypothetical protein